MLLELLMFLFFLKEDRDIEKIEQEIQRIDKRLDHLSAPKYHYPTEDLEDLK